jgi:hypothetical protein
MCLYWPGQPDEISSPVRVWYSLVVFTVDQLSAAMASVAALSGPPQVASGGRGMIWCPC